MMDAKIKRRTLLRSTISLLAGTLLKPALSAENYPNRPIRIIVPSAAGSGTDNIVRQVSNYLTQKRGWNFVIDNKPGANGFLAVQAVKRAPSDGYTLLCASSSVMSYNPVAYKNTPYDPITDFDPIIRAVVAPLVVFAAPRYHFDSLTELVTLLRRQPFTYATYGNNRVSAERFLQDIKVSGKAIPYKTNPEAVIGVIGGFVDFMFVDTGIATSLIKAGQIKALAITSKQRTKSLPDVPTLIEAGFPGFESTAWTGYFAPKGTSTAIVDEVHSGILEFFNTPQGKQFVASIGGYFEDVTPMEFHHWMSDEIEVNRTVYKKSGLSAE